MKELFALNKYFYRYKWHLLGGIFFVLLSCVFAIIPAQIVRYAFDLIANTIKMNDLFEGTAGQKQVMITFRNVVLLYGGIILLMAFIRGVFLFLQRQTIIVMSRLIEYDLKNDIYVHYQKLPLAFYRKNNTGDLMNRISEDVSQVRMYLGPAIMYTINMIGTAVLVISYMLTINVRLTLFALLPLPILSLSIYYVNNLINKRSILIQKSLSQMTTFVQEAFSGIRVLKAYNRENDFSKEFEGETKEYFDKSVDLVRVNSLFLPLIVGLIGLSTILTVYIGGIEVMKGTITTGNIAEFVIYVNLLTWPVASLGWVTSLTQRAAASQERINEFLNTKSEILSLKNKTTSINGEVTFENVTLVYPDSGIKALDNISFEIREGQTLAILGTTGSGKSTIANLICRMYDVTSGKILIDHTNIKDYEIQYLRSNVGYVPQEVFLFSDSIRNNIAFGFNENDFEENQIKEAARDADLLENIERFPEGFETMLGERGITLSGGQKQRVSIARAIIRNPKIMILDDSLSAVDTKTENAILQNMKRIMKNRTSIIISHRVSSAKLADYIIFLDEGKITEQGTHQELLKLGGLYTELYEKQLHEEVS
ncbi:ABC-type multidrug transport system, ATPase and permease component [Bernardetia litoralis DSM 6794]|uniref:ABC-type multidrug transport system, ATPase and permease component n=1 Tax=Bernardetia litoralis (strain ATCC 23117 / DSM 6794 / NBRC 15988 / NCIMB 1366 / Fx l1 / Sio-4) TaxID=880071 RepID=I4AM76_BERLS|nr:ABC transporter ATP-binding protein [Bernardetia litoralis]AFM05061.1 ABC-type multidrug transport system, ATPase and permease component [Bernardetia litoralis DSM 6794]